MATATTVMMRMSNLSSRRPANGLQNIVINAEMDDIIATSPTPMCMSALMGWKNKPMPLLMPPRHRPIISRTPMRTNHAKWIPFFLAVVVAMFTSCVRSVAGTVRDSVTILADRYPPQTVLRPGRYEAVLVKTMFSGVTLSRALDFRVAFREAGCGI